MGGEEGGRETLTVTLWGTQDIGVGAVHGEARADEGDTGKALSVAANKAGARGRNGERPVQRGGEGSPAVK